AAPPPRGRCRRGGGLSPGRSCRGRCAPRCRLRSGGGNRSWSGGYPRVTLPEVQGGKGASLAQVVADEAGDEAAVSGRVRAVEQRQIRARVVQGEEITV